jgi:hypothetical protein
MTKHTLGVDPTTLNLVVGAVAVEVVNSSFDVTAAAAMLEKSEEFLRYIDGYMTGELLQMRTPDERRRWDLANILAEGIRMGQVLERLQRSTETAPSLPPSFTFDISGTANVQRIH